MGKSNSKKYILKNPGEIDHYFDVDRFRSKVNSKISMPKAKGQSNNNCI